jgi:regulator of replication initiation timing
MPATAQHPDLKSTLLDLLKEEHELSSEAERLKRVLEHGGDVTLREGSNDEEEKEPTEIAEKSSEAMAR